MVAASLRRSYLWQRIRQIHLHESMRLRNDPESSPFAEYLLRVVNGSESTIDEDAVIGGHAPRSAGT